MEYVVWHWASSMRCGQPSAISTPLWTTIFFSMSGTSGRWPLGDVLLPLFRQLVELLHKPADISHLALVLQQAVLQQVQKKDVHIRKPPELVRRALLHEVPDHALFQVAEPAVDQKQVQLVNLHRLTINLAAVVPRMA